LAKRGHTVHILTREGDELGEFESSVKVWRIGKNWRESLFSYEDARVYFHTSMFLIKSFLRLLILKLKGVNYDVVSVHFVTEAFLMRFAKRLFGWPYVFILEGYTDLEGREARYADLQIAISEYIAEKCLRNFHYAPLLLPVGIDLNRFNTNIDGTAVRKKYVQDGEKLVLTVCRLDPRKDVLTLISSADIIRRKCSKVKFVITGDGIQRAALEKGIKQSGLCGKVIIERNVRREELPQYYKACDVFALPTLYEGFGIVFLEAMACGIPIISTTVPAVPEVVEDSGILIPPKKPELLAERILEVLRNDELRRRLIQNGLERVKRYDWERLIVTYERAYESVTRK